MSHFSPFKAHVAPPGSGGGRANRFWMVMAFLVAGAIGCGHGDSGPQSQPVTAQDREVDASRLLTQASFGPKDEELKTLMDAGPDGWLKAQFAMPPSGSFLDYMDGRRSQLEKGGTSIGPNQFYEFFYATAAKAPDQLRERMAFALSQIFVVSMKSDGVRFYIRSAGSYYDMLRRDAFANFRKVLEDVTLHPAMGLYLSSICNLPEDRATGRIPDENYAREVMQLMSIGLFQLNPDGTEKLDSQGNPIPTYSHDDIAGLAKVFTGFGWFAPNPTDETFRNGVGSDSETNPMSLYPQFHSTSAKTFLGTTIPASAASDPAGDVKKALDTLFNHPNVGPFIAIRLIQQFVTSNPSPGYVARVASVFDNDGLGRRGDLEAVLKAVLMDREARDKAVWNTPAFGKLREPVLRFTNWMRAFGAESQSKLYLVPETDQAAVSLAQSPLNSPSVFNFWSPGYRPPFAGFQDVGKTGPEFQVVDEVSAAGYVNFVEQIVDQGFGGGAGTLPATQGPDVQARYPRELALSVDPDALTKDIDRMLLCGTMSSPLRERLRTAIEGVPLPEGGGPSLDRVKLAVFLTLSSPEYLQQR